MKEVLLIAAAAATALTAVAHSYLGERRLIAPLLGLRHGVLALPLARQVIRFAWHLTAALWAVQELVLLRAAFVPGAFDRIVIGGIGVVHLTAGLGDAIVTRGKHIGWPLLSAIGILALLAAI